MTVVIGQHEPTNASVGVGYRTLSHSRHCVERWGTKVGHEILTWYKQWSSNWPTDSCTENTKICRCFCWKTTDNDC